MDVLFPNDLYILSENYGECRIGINLVYRVLYIILYCYIGNYLFILFRMWVENIFLIYICLNGVLFENFVGTPIWIKCFFPTGEKGVSSETAVSWPRSPRRCWDPVHVYVAEYVTIIFLKSVCNTNRHLLKLYKQLLLILHLH